LKNNLISHILFSLILLGGLLLLGALVWIPQKKKQDYDKIPFNKDNLIEINKNLSLPKNIKIKNNIKTGLTGSLLSYVPSGFHVGLSVNIKSMKKFYWSHALLSLSSQPKLKRKLDSLNISLKGVENLAFGVSTNQNFVRFKKKVGLRLTLPPSIFLLHGIEGRLEALRRYWKKIGGKEKNYIQGDFILGFPKANTHLLVGTYKTDITPVLKLVSGNRKYQDLCSMVNCKKEIKNFGLIPSLIFIFASKNPLRIYGNLKIKSIFVTAELNPDGILLRGKIESNTPCNQAISKLTKYLSLNLNKFNVEDILIKRSLLICRSPKELIITIPIAASEIKSQLILLGLLK
jgi:hypothetical protein